MAEDQKITTMLMFLGRAEEAMQFYTSIFSDAGIDSIAKYGPDYPQGPEGQIVHAEFHLKGEPFMAMDSAVDQPFTFTPSISLFVTCDDEPEIDRLFTALTDRGEVLMPLQEYPFARKYAWVADRFGVSWQLSLG